MFYFIPSWYNHHRKWYDNTVAWYWNSDQMNFDDTISQLRMFQKSNQDSQVLILNYMPNLRSFMQRYGLLEQSMWSLFDRVQDIDDVEEKMFDFKQLSWPEDAEFIYTPFAVVVKRCNEKIAVVEFGENGRVIWIDYFVGNQMMCKYIFDDRGFLSSMLYFNEEGSAYYQDYLNRFGEIQIREYLLEHDTHVEVYNDATQQLKKSHYNNMDELIKDMMQQYLSQNLGKDDTLFIASNEQHNQLLLSIPKQASVVLSFFQNRFNIVDIDKVVPDIMKSDLIISDKISHVESLSQLTDKPVLHISPFDTRLALGKSQRVKELNIYYLVDNQSHDDVAQTLFEIFKVMEENQDVFLNIVTYSKEYGVVQQLEGFIKELLDSRPEKYLRLSDEVTDEVYEVEGLLEPIVPPRVDFLKLHTEIDIIKALEYTRLIIDMAQEPNLYTQIAGISAGIPQINTTKTEFVEHLKNGQHVRTKEEVRQALHYYLDTLTNWNQSLVYAVHKMTDYTSGAIVDKIRERLKEEKYGK